MVEPAQSGYRRVMMSRGTLVAKPTKTALHHRALLASLMTVLAGCGATPRASGTAAEHRASSVETPDVARGNSNTPSPTGPAPISGVAGGSIAASSLGAGCVGRVPFAPQTVLELSVATELSLSVRSGLDSTLAVVLPDGTAVCNDDAEGLDARVTEVFPPGAHPVYVGTFDGVTGPFELTIGPPLHVSVRYGDLIPGVPRFCGMAEPSTGPIRIGSPVMLGAHSPYEGPDGHGGYVVQDTWWNDGMAPLVGQIGRVTEIALDPVGCPHVRVDVDGGTWGWRVRDLRVTPGIGGGIVIE